MFTVGPQLDLEALVACDVTALQTADAVIVLQRSGRIRAWLDSFDAGVAAHLDTLAAAGHSAPVADVLSRQGISAAEARRRERRAKALAKAKEFGQALADGKVGAEHADVLANAASKLDDDDRSGVLLTPTRVGEGCSRHVPGDSSVGTVRNLIDQIEATTASTSPNVNVVRPTCHARSTPTACTTSQASSTPSSARTIWKALDPRSPHSSRAGGDRHRRPDHRSPPRRSATSCPAAIKPPVRSKPTSAVVVDHQTVTSGLARPHHL